MKNEEKQSIPRNGEVGKSGSATGSSVDPTKNVLDLVEAAVKRIDDLAEVKDKTLLDKLNDEKSHIREVLQLTRNYEEKLTVAEAKRIDAIRAVDVNAVGVANQKSADQALVLANQVSNSAETLRKLVETTAAAAAAQFQQVTTLLSDRIASLEQTQYRGAGKESVTDPIMQQLLIEMKATRESVGESKAKSTGINAAWGYLVGAIGIALLLYNSFK